MKGSVYYQSSILTKCIFIEGVKKVKRVNKDDASFNCVASYKTMETYRNVWNRFFNYLKEHWKVKNCEKITEEHVLAYMEYTLEYYPSKQYLEKISCALGKLEFALNKYSIEKYSENATTYNFDIRKKVLIYARNLNLISKNYVNRNYSNPELIISNLSTKSHQAAAKIQLYGGARVEAVTLIKKEQLKDCIIDKVTGEDVGVLETKEKGGKVGDVYIPLSVYNELYNHFFINNMKTFKINYQSYSKDINAACISLGVVPMGSHGFRWSYVNRRLLAYQKNGYSYEQSLQEISYEIKHERASITEHYIG